MNASFNHNSLVPQNMAVVLFPYSLLNYIHEFVNTINIQMQL